MASTIRVQHTKTLVGHRDSVWSVTFSPNGTELASSDGLGTIMIWNAHTGRATATASAGEHRTSTLAYLSNEQTLLSGVSSDPDFVTKFWDTSTWTERSELRMRGNHPTLSSDESILATAIHKTHDIVLWDPIRRVQLRRLPGHTHWVTCLAFSPDSSMLASTGWDRRIILWDVASGEQINANNRYMDVVYSVCFSTDGQLLAAGSADPDQYLELWDAQSLDHRGSLRGHADSVRSVVFSPDGGLLASGSSDHTVKLWDVANRKLLVTLVGHTGSVTALAFSPSGDRLASASRDETVMLWDIDHE